MVQNKNKNHTPNNLTIQAIVTTIGTTAMLAASVCGVFEHMDKEGHRLITALQPASNFIAQPVDSHANSDELLRRGGKEEVHGHGATYGVARRSPSVSGAV